VVVSLTGALCLVQLIRNGGNSSPAYIIGYWMSKWLGKGFIAFAFLLGALGSFFSGSTTVSNLTFGEVNSVAAAAVGIPVNGLLGLQTAGAVPVHPFLSPLSCLLTAFYFSPKRNRQKTPTRTTKINPKNKKQQGKKHET
jgi:L-lactate permease